MRAAFPGSKEQEGPKLMPQVPITGQIDAMQTTSKSQQQVHNPDDVIPPKISATVLNKQVELADFPTLKALPKELLTIWLDQAQQCPHHIKSLCSYNQAYPKERTSSKVELSQLGSLREGKYEADVHERIM